LYPHLVGSNYDAGMVLCPPSLCRRPFWNWSDTRHWQFHISLFPTEDALQAKRFPDNIEHISRGRMFTHANVDCSILYDAAGIDPCCRCSCIANVFPATMALVDHLTTGIALQRSHLCCNHHARCAPHPQESTRNFSGRRKRIKAVRASYQDPLSRQLAALHQSLQ